MAKWQKYRRNIKIRSFQLRRDISRVNRRVYLKFEEKSDGWWRLGFCKLGD